MVVEFPLKSTRPVPKKVESHYKTRIAQFIQPNSPYANLNLPQHFDRQRLSDEDHIKLRVFSVPDLKRPSFSEMQEMAHSNWRPAHIGDNFGPSWSTHWFHVHVKIPSKWLDFNEPIVFEFDSSDEGMLYSNKGEVIQGLSAEHGRTQAVIPNNWLQNNDDWVTFYIETSCNNIDGTGAPPDPNRYFTLKQADLVLPRMNARSLYWDLRVLLDAVELLEETSWQKHRSLDILNRVVNMFDHSKVDESCVKGREMAAKFLGTVDNLGKPLGGECEGSVYAIGNCHIDTAWLWPFAETRRKIARSWASQLRMIEKYPDFVFVASQSVQFEWLKEDHPELFERIREAMKTTRFVPIGGSFVESDTNMPSGESLVRQMVLGQQFYEKEFGMRSKIYWLPDSFGYSPQLPQISRSAGMPYFLTQKLSWNNIDVFPLSTFSWVGLDGSQVLCHMPPANSYTTNAHLSSVRKSIMQHKNLDTTSDAMMLFGYGDGGGGPIDHMVEEMRRCRGLADQTAAIPKVHTGLKFLPDMFFDRIVEKTNGGRDLPTWEGELYLEYHRGTYTTQADIKKGNRKCEFLLFEVEYLATAASLASSEYKYPFDAIKSLWKKVCLNQFHDVLPGSGISMIYEDARKLYDEVLEGANQIIDGALDVLGYNTRDVDSSNTSDMLRLDRGTMQFTSMDNINDSDTVNDSKFASTYGVEDMLGVVTLDDTCSNNDSVDTFELNHSKFHLKFVNGKIVEITDRVNYRPMLTPGEVANQFYLFDDQPMNFPAWDTDQFASERYEILEPTYWHRLSHRAAEVTYKFNKSKIYQKITVHDTYIDFETSVDWHETYKFLKTEFPVEVVSDFATYETSFGIQKRPTHFNTSWDTAKFEVCAHTFADLSDWRVGYTLINDCKYGYSIHGNRMSLSLLRSPKAPDANADMGHHEFKYALLPHKGPLSPEIVRYAHLYNTSPRLSKPAKNGKPLYRAFNLFNMSDAGSALFSAVKRGERDNENSDKCTIVARLYETMGGKTSVKFNPQFKCENVYFSNILEDPESYEEVHGEDNVYQIDLTPFEFKTIVFHVSK